VALEAIYPRDLKLWLKPPNKRGTWRRHVDPAGLADRPALSAGLDASCARWLHPYDVAILGSDAARDVGVAHQFGRDFLRSSYGGC
jgi:hypothetical protein